MGINKAWNDRLTLKIYHVHVNRDSYTITGSDLLNASIHNHDCARINTLISPFGHYGGSCECDIMTRDATPGQIELARAPRRERRCHAVELSRVAASPTN